MKKLRILSFLAVSLLIITPACGQESQNESEIDSGIKWMTLEEAQKEAKKSGQKILIFGYTDWCTYCRKMRKETYTQDEVQKLMNDEYISVQINAESEEIVTYNGKEYTMRELSKNIRLESFPTHYFLDSDGKIIAAQPGFLPAEVFSPLMSYIVEDKFGKVPFLDYLEQKGIKLEQE